MFTKHVPECRGNGYQNWIMTFRGITDRRDVSYSGFCNDPKLGNRYHGCSDDPWKAQDLGCDSNFHGVRCCQLPPGVQYFVCVLRMCSSAVLRHFEYSWTKYNIWPLVNTGPARPPAFPDDASDEHHVAAWLGGLPHWSQWKLTFGNCVERTSMRLPAAQASHTLSERGRTYTYWCGSYRVLCSSSHVALTSHWQMEPGYPLENDHLDKCHARIVCRGAHSVQRYRRTCALGVGCTALKRRPDITWSTFSSSSLWFLFLFLNLRIVGAWTGAETVQILFRNSFILLSKNTDLDKVPNTNLSALERKSRASSTTSLGRWTIG